MLKLFSLVVLLALAHCAGVSDGDRPDGGGQPDAWSDAADASTPFELSVLDTDAPGDLPVAIAARGDRVGVAYFAETSADGGVELRFVEPNGAPQVVATVARQSAETGVSVTWDEGGNPHIAYLGGGSDESLFWLQSDFAVASRAGATWTSEVLVRSSGEAASGLETSDFGIIVGLSPVLLTTPTGLFGAYRDVHGGQFASDYAHSDIESVEGAPGAWANHRIVVLGGNGLAGHGGVMSGALGSAGPALAWSVRPSSATDVPSEVWFARRATDGSWTEPAQIAAPGDTGVGPSLAWSQRCGFAIAYEDRGTGVLSYVESADGANWSAPEPIFGVGTGGWYPSVAFAGDGEPSIAFYVCSSVSQASSCRSADDALYLSHRKNGRWPAVAQIVDADGARWPRLAMRGGKPVIAYKDPAAKVLKLAVAR